MANYNEVITRWHDRLTGVTDRQNLSNQRMPTNDDAIFSYGSHFPLVVAARDRKGRAIALVLNGDQSTVSTTGHQSRIQSMAETSPLRHEIVPFSALGAAGIDPADVEIVDTVPDREETTRTERHTLPPRNRFRVLPVTKWVDADANEIERRLEEDFRERLEKWGRSQGPRSQPPPREDSE